MTPHPHIEFIFQPYQKRYKWKLKDDVRVTLRNGEIFIIPKGIKTDGRTNLGLFDWLIPRWPRIIIPYLLHDALYILDYKVKELGFQKAQKWADDEMLFQVKRYGNKRDIFEGYISYFFVRMLGRYDFKKLNNGVVN